MKIAGVDPKTLPQEEILVIPKGDQSLVLRARGVTDFTEFHALVPEPKAQIRLVGGKAEPDTESGSYKADMLEYTRRHISWMVIKSLEPSEIEWDTVNPDVPGTWVNWEADFLSNGLLQNDCNRILNLVWEANSLDEKKIKQAREVFLHGLKLVSAM